jgi:hypothetical protein
MNTEGKIEISLNITKSSPPSSRPPMYTRTTSPSLNSTAGEPNIDPNFLDCPMLNIVMFIIGSKGEPSRLPSLLRPAHLQTICSLTSPSL